MVLTYGRHCFTGLAAIECSATALYTVVNHCKGWCPVVECHPFTGVCSPAKMHYLTAWSALPYNNLHILTSLWPWNDSSSIHFKFIMVLKGIESTLISICNGLERSYCQIHSFIFCYGLEMTQFVFTLSL